MHEVVCGEQGNVDHRSRRATTARLAGELGDAATASFEAIDTDTCSRAFSEAAAALVGFDVVVVAIGKIAFVPGAYTDDAVVEHMLAINTRAPVALVRAALLWLQVSRETVAVLSTVLADYPTPDLAPIERARVH